MTAAIESVSLSPAHGFSKQPRNSIRLLTGEGVEGDAHCGRFIQHLYLQRKDPTTPNHSQVHLFASEMLDELRGKGFAVAAGELGENVLTRGIDLLALPTGTRLYLGNKAVVELTGLRTPCHQIDKLQNGLQQHLWGDREASGKRSRRAGVMSIVLTGGDVHAGDPMRVEFPPEPHQPLVPV
ncbi:MAG: MOSC domain-containing protein [Acidobacteriaceae bacterium]|nr:MOSC domain-containing protein [Acidobacteriaceae bacterium]